MSFANRVYGLLRLVPPGRVTTYKIIAEKLNCRAYRAVGTALRKNPYAPEVPCHRVVRSDGAIGGFMGETIGTKIQKKIALLANENIEVVNGYIANFSDKLFYF